MNTAFALTHASVVTGDADGRIISDQTIVVESDGRISAVSAASDTVVPRTHQVFDLTGKYVTPGLINAHAHLFADGKPLPAILSNESLESAVAVFFHSPFGRSMIARRAKANVATQLNSGVTTLRSLGDVAYELVALRNQVEAGKLPGPRILASGPLLAVSGGHGTPLIARVSDDPWTARRNVRINLRAGVDAIKIAATGGVTDARTIGEAGRPQMTEAEMAAICEEAHNAGVIVAAHAESVEGVHRALRAGVDTIEHGSEMDEEIIGLFKHNPKALRGSSALVPTFMAALPLVKLSQSATGVSDVVKANGKIVLDRIIQGVKDAVANDIALGMGTDSALTYVTHYNTWREMDYAVRYGQLTPAQALHAATQSNAEILGLSQITGAVAPGKHADLAVLSGNPLEPTNGFRAFDSIHMVVASGHIIDTPTVTRFPEIDRQLDSF